jgi:hypothetical protein
MRPVKAKHRRSMKLITSTTKLSVARLMTRALIVCQVHKRRVKNVALDSATISARCKVKAEAIEFAFPSQTLYVKKE